LNLKKGLPKIEATVKQPKPGDSIELICQVKNLPKRFELTWIFNERKISAHTLTSANGTYGRQQQNGKSRRHHEKVLLINEEEKKAEELEQLMRSHRHHSQPRLHHAKRSHQQEASGHHGYTIFNEQFNNVTMSRLKITDLGDIHRGVYKCRYDKIETKITLDFKSNKVLFFFYLNNFDFIL
jgi:hypothetical protein